MSFRKRNTYGLELYRIEINSGNFLNIEASKDK